MAESAGKMYALATVLSLLAIVATALRFYARRIKQAALSWDDYMILPALVCRAMLVASSESCECETNTETAFYNCDGGLHVYR